MVSNFGTPSYGYPKNNPKYKPRAVSDTPDYMNNGGGSVTKPSPRPGAGVIAFDSNGGPVSQANTQTARQALAAQSMARTAQYDQNQSDAKQAIFDQNMARRQREGAAQDINYRIADEKRKAAAAREKANRPRMTEDDYKKDYEAILRQNPTSGAAKAYGTKAVDEAEGKKKAADITRKYTGDNVGSAKPFSVVPAVPQTPAQQVTEKYLGGFGPDASQSYQDRGMQRPQGQVSAAAPSSAASTPAPAPVAPEQMAAAGNVVNGVAGVARGVAGGISNLLGGAFDSKAQTQTNPLSGLARGYGGGALTDAATGGATAPVATTNGYNAAKNAWGAMQPASPGGLPVTQASAPAPAGFQVPSAMATDIINSGLTPGSGYQPPTPAPAPVAAQPVAAPVQSTGYYPPPDPATGKIPGGSPVAPAQSTNYPPARDPNTGLIPGGPTGVSGSQGIVGPAGQPASQPVAPPTATAPAAAIAGATPVAAPQPEMPQAVAPAVGPQMSPATQQYASSAPERQAGVDRALAATAEAKRPATPEELASVNARTLGTKESDQRLRESVGGRYGMQDADQINSKLARQKEADNTSGGSVETADKTKAIADANKKIGARAVADRKAVDEIKPTNIRTKPKILTDKEYRDRQNEAVGDYADSRRAIDELKDARSRGTTPEADRASVAASQAAEREHRRAMELEGVKSGVSQEKAGRERQEKAAKANIDMFTREIDSLEKRLGAGGFVDDKAKADAENRLAENKRIAEGILKAKSYSSIEDAEGSAKSGDIVYVDGQYYQISGGIGGVIDSLRGKKPTLKAQPTRIR